MSSDGHAVITSLSGDIAFILARMYVKYKLDLESGSSLTSEELADRQQLEDCSRFALYQPSHL
jgi:hypothetical protein